MATRKETTHLVIHCSATRPSQDIGVKEIDRWHRARGFFKIGYHLVIRRDGTVEVGRKIEEIGAHCKDGGMNRCAIGICLVGGVSEADVKVAEDNFTKAQKVSLFGVIKQLRTEHSGLTILGHRDVPGVRKDCPSFDVSAWMLEAFPGED